MLSKRNVKVKVMKSTVVLGCALPFLLLAGASRCPAQVMLSPAFEAETADKPSEKSVDEESETTRDSTPPAADGPDSDEPRPIYAAAEPDPSLRYRLWPAVVKQRPHDATPFISRALLMQHQAIHGDPESAADYNEGYVRFADTTIDELPRDEVRRFLDRYGEAALKELERAENRMGVSYDLGLNELSISEAVSTLLPEVQEMRNLARLLQLRARLAIAEGRWDDAVDDLRLGLRLSEFAGQTCDFIVTRLVGMAIAGMMLGTIEEASRLPDSPNLYWALTTVPASRLFDATDAIEFELDFWGRLYEDSPPPDDPIGADASRRELVRLFESYLGMLSLYPEPDAETQRLFLGLAVVMGSEPSREMLAETPAWTDRTDQLSAPEAVWRAGALRFQRTRDEKLKWLRMPAASYRKHSDAGRDPLPTPTWNDPIGVLAHMNSVAVHPARRASDHLRQRLHFLITIEAIRMDAGSRGELHESLSDLAPVPAWDDPITGEPFEYQRTAPTTATLSRVPRFSDEPDAKLTIELIPHGESK